MQGRGTDLIWQDDKLLSPGRILPGDRTYNGMRVWEPQRSKVAALCYLNYEPPICHARILYLGAAAGTTVSFLSDYAEVVYAVEFSSRPIRNLIRLARQRSNIIPFFQDARYPERYIPFIESVDILIQDIAQRDQVEIAVKNLSLLKNGGHFILFLKMLSISVVSGKDELTAIATNLLKDAGIKKIVVTGLEKYHTGHVAISGIYGSKEEIENK